MGANAGERSPLARFAAEAGEGEAGAHDTTNTAADRLRAVAGERVTVFAEVSAVPFGYGLEENDGAPDRLHAFILAGAGTLAP